MAPNPSLKVANLGRILGGLGLLLLLSSPFTLFLTSGSFSLFATKAAAGLALLLFYLATNHQRLGQFASRRSSFFFASTTLLMLLTLAGLGALNYVAHVRNRSWDLTENQVYTLSPQTVGVLRGLREPVRAIAFLSAEHPAREALRTTFERYRTEAPESFSYSFEDPVRRPDLTAKYKLRGGQMTVVLVRGEGAQESHLSLNVVSEQDLTNALLQLTRAGERWVDFVIGHGEWPLNSVIPQPGQKGRTTGLSELRQQLVQEGYTPREINLGGGTPIPRSTAVLVVAGAKGPFSPPEVEVLSDYLDAGGRMIFFAEAYGEPGPELRALLMRYGVAIDPGVVADSQFNGGSPYLIESLFFGDHEISRLLRQRQLNLELPTARGLSLVSEGLGPGMTVETVLRTSPFAWEESTPDANPQPTEGERTGQISLVTASTRPTADVANKRSDQTRLIVMGDSELLFDSNWGHEGNRNLVMNAFAWTTQQADKITLRPPDRATSTLTLDAEQLGRIRFLATDVMPLSLLGLGLVIWLWRRNK